MTATSTPIPDLEIRRQAIATRGHAFVWASAGTGKTHLLTLRALYLLLNAPFLEPSREESEGSDLLGLYEAGSRAARISTARAVIRSLVLTTFTRKAAAEMQTRLYRYLETIASSESFGALESGAGTPGLPPDTLFLEVVRSALDPLESRESARSGDFRERAFHRLRSGAQALAELATEMQIATLHSFAASILHRHPLEAGIPPSARFAREDEDDVTGVEDQLVDLWWRRRVLRQPRLRERLSRLLQVVPAYQIRRWLKTCYGSRWILEEIHSLPASASDLAQDFLRAGEAVVEGLAGASGSRITACREELSALLEEAAARTPGALTRLCQFLDRERHYLFLDGRDLTQTVRKALQALPEGHRRFFDSWLRAYVPVSHLCLATELAGEWELWKDFLEEFSGWLEESALQELGMVPFDEMIRRTVRLLEDHPQARRMEQRRLRAILVDEFQDTDPEQLKILRALFKDTGTRTLGFFVGDPKQSIYRFRGADLPSIENFSRAFQDLAGSQRSCREFRLTSNFRSLPGVTGFVNPFFLNQLPLADPEEALVPIRQGPGSQTSWLLAQPEPSGNVSASAARENAAALTAGVIRDYLRDSKAENPRYRDVLVLVRDSKEANALLPVLYDAGIPTVSGGTKTFYRNPEVLDVLNLLIALLHPQDRLAGAGLLRSPLVLLSDPEIYRLLEAVPAEELLHSERPLPDSLPEAAAERIRRLRRAARSRTSRTLNEWLHEVRSLVPTALYSHPGEREGQPLVRTDRIFDRFRQEMEHGIAPALVWLLKQRARSAESGRFDTDPGEDVTISDESVDAVRVMTVHKAKGLEGRLVIVFCWASLLNDLAGGGGGRPVQDVLHPTLEEGEELRAFCLPWGPLQVASPAYASGLEQEAAGTVQETQRLAYVAATRARDRLVLIFSAPARTTLPGSIEDLLATGASESDAGGEPLQPYQGSLLLAASRVPPVESRPLGAPKRGWDLQDYVKLWRDRYEKSREEAKRPLLCHPSDDGPPEPPEFTEDNHYLPEAPSGGLLTGRLVHQYLEHHLLAPALDESRLKDLASASREIHPVDGSLERAQAILRGFFEGRLKDPEGRALAERVRGGRVLAREMPFYLFWKHQKWTGVIDLVLEEEGVVRAIDYKTSAPKDPLPEAYGRQAQVYTELLRQVFPGKEVGFEFWWLEEVSGA